jgi:hypothetical protein
MLLEDKIRIRFEKQYSPGLWRDFYKYFIKQNIGVSDMTFLFAGAMSRYAVRRWCKKMEKLK